MKRPFCGFNKTKNVIFVTVALLLFATLLCSCGTLRFDFDVDGFPEYLPSGDETGAPNSSPEYEGSREEISIGKNQGINPEGDKITSAGQAYNSISEVYYAISGSVVEITTETVQNGSWMGQYVTEGAGSGVIIDKRGFIVTNHHVVDGATNILVRLTTGEEFAAVLMGSDQGADIAVIKINASDLDLTVAPLGCSGDLVVGEDIAVIGNPLGSLGGTLTTGIISATERTINVGGTDIVLLQTNAAINPGNSGGGMFNMAGELVGIVNAKMAGSDIEGLGFAIPVDYAHGIIEDLISYGYVKGVADHGLILLDVTNQNLPAAYYQYGITGTGVVILESKLTDELVCGDIVISVNDTKITSSANFDSVVRSYSVGDEITVKVRRGGKIVSVSYALGERNAMSIGLE